MSDRTLDAVLLGAERKLTRLDVARQAGVEPERLRRLWGALGFAAVDDEAQVFTEADVRAARTATELLGSGLVDAGLDAGLTRALGHHLSRLAEWQVQVVAEWLRAQPGEGLDEELGAQLAESVLPVVAELQDYVWRRHLAAFAGRMLAEGAEGGDGDGARRHRVVGFVDMVGYTRLTRRLDERELVLLLEYFESLAAEVIAQGGGRVVKTIGDEVLFTCDDPVAAAETALALGERALDQARLPGLRTGLACGAVLSRLGDVYGEVVNIAARLTAIARPGTILVDESLATRLADTSQYRLRALRPVPVRGYRRLRPCLLRRA
ncbi:adenylate/guanylate cyclase domain-containing protein [Streptomyces monticola]|uniref:Adenylate/guanylate cyclase domain-containing protein n=1 Tax=Streptomyces monticola TaxID=2666263 RepID=A0ABW2JAH5_9ACTN